MIRSFSELLNKAGARRVGIGAFNIGNKDIFEAIVKASEDTGTPAIIAVSIPELNYVGDAFISYVRQRITSSKAAFCLHLDHGKAMDEIKRAINLGFNSVMIDASDKRFEENAEITRNVVDYAHARNVEVEGELGTIGSTASSSCVDGHDATIIFTDPHDAEQFCRETHVDALAVAIGTSHGLYPKGQTPHLRFDILKAIRARVETPLVLHGGSGNAESELVQAVQEGISKVNISSEVKSAYFDALRTYLHENPDEVKTQIVFKEPCIAAYETIISKMNLFDRS